MPLLSQCVNQAKPLSEEKKSIIKTLLRQTARWANAAGQDASPLVATLHQNYSLGYYYALKDIATDQEIEQATGINPVDFQHRLTQYQDLVTKQVVAECPRFAKNIDLTFAEIAGQ